MKFAGSRLREALNTSRSINSPMPSSSLPSTTCEDQNLHQRIAELESKAETDASMISTLRTFLEQGRTERDNLYRSKEDDAKTIQLLKEKLLAAEKDLSIHPKEVYIEVPVRPKSVNENDQIRLMAEIERKANNFEKRCFALEKDLDESRSLARTLEAEYNQSADKLKHCQTEKEAIGTQLRVHRKLVVELKARVKEMEEISRKTQKTIKLSKSHESDENLSLLLKSASEALAEKSDELILKSSQLTEQLKDLEILKNKISEKEKLLELTTNEKNQISSELLNEKVKSDLEISTLKEKLTDRDEEVKRLSIMLDREKQTISEMIQAHDFECTIKDASSRELTERIASLNDKLLRMKFPKKSDAYCQKDLPKNVTFDACTQLTAETPRPMISDSKILKKLKPLLDCVSCGVGNGRLFSLLPCSHNICEKCLENKTNNDRLLNGIQCDICKLPSTYALPAKILDKIAQTLRAIEKENREN